MDDANVRAEGFLPQQYEFELDQARILDLLTGHTLYNDSGVVIRELTQNAIDAVRLQAQEDNLLPEKFGKVEVLWSNKESTLEVIDNGTGMTQDIIERHLLKVGSSRYQDEKFKETHPEFSPISRFGIGILSAFMIADTVEIATCAASEALARQISLRSVHGRYLIRLLDKEVEPVAKRVAPHGTSVKLKLRPTAKRVDILGEVRRWIMFPKCSVSVQVDSGVPVQVGFNSPKDALESYLKTGAFSNILERYRVEERTREGLALAYVLSYNPFFRDWTFVSVPSERQVSGGESIGCTCVEGVTVETGSPGFLRGGLLAIANATGKNAPKTNVARSALEENEGSIAAIQKIYDLYVEQLDEECRRLMSEEKYPLSGAISQLEYISSGLEWNSGEYFSRHNECRYPELLKASFSRLPVFLLEGAIERKAASLDDLRKLGKFWTVEAPLFRSLEVLIRQMPVNITARAILEFAKGGPQLPSEPVVSNLNSQYARALIVGIFEIKRISAIESGHRLELEWGLLRESLWYSQSALFERLYRLDSQAAFRIRENFEERYDPNRMRMQTIPGDIRVPKSEVAIDGLKGFSAVTAQGDIYFLPGAKFVERQLPAFLSNKFNEIAQGYIYLEIARFLLAASPASPSATQDIFDRAIRTIMGSGLDSYLPDVDEAREVACATEWQTYDPFAWSRERF